MPNGAGSHFDDLDDDDVDDIDVSVVMACYTEERLDSIDAALISLRKQALEPRKMIVAVDNNLQLANRLRDEYDWVTVILNSGDRGASATRNCGVTAVESPFTAFLDDDETAEPNWLKELMQPFCDPGVVGSGGRYEATWLAGKPVWFPEEFAWAVGGSYAGLPTVTSPVRNVWSGNMAVRTEAFWRVGGFRTDFGKRGSIPQPEDTDLCIRMADATGGQWMYVPSAVINHDVPEARASLRFFASRCFAEGRGKALMSKQLNSASAIGTERDYARNATLAAMRRFVSLRWGLILQGLAMMLGLASAAFGFLVARVVDASVSGRRVESLSAVVEKPALILEYELSTPVQSFVQNLGDLTDYRRVCVLVKALGKPVGVVMAPASADAIEQATLNSLRAELSVVIADIAGGDQVAIARLQSGLGHPVAELDASTNIPTGSPPPPSVTVAICTRERPDLLARALDSLLLQPYRDFAVVIVDNAPTSSATSSIANRYRDRFSRFEYIVEPTPGLARARNRALAHVRTEVVAFIDDDEVVDSNWLPGIVRAFRCHPDAAAVSGSVFPAELETWPQWWFEVYGGHSKGRGFTAAVFRRGDAGAQSPLYPLPVFGAGGNMAFRRTILADIGGFDNSLGAGTVTCGAEDTLVFSQLLLSGYTVVYEPAAMTRHFHHRSLPSLERQMFGYGVGLTAFYAALLRWDWRLIFSMLALLPRAMVYVLGQRGSSAAVGDMDEIPSHLFRIKVRGMLFGPIAYIRARRRARRIPACE